MADKSGQSLESYPLFVVQFYATIFLYMFTFAFQDQVIFFSQELLKPRQVVTVTEPYKYLYNDTENFETLTTPAGDALISRKFQKFREKGFGQLGLVVTETDFDSLDASAKQKIYKKLNLSNADHKTLIFVVDNIEDSSHFNFQLIVGRDWLIKLDANYVAQDLVQDSIRADENIFKAIMQAVDYSIEQIVGPVEAQSFNNMPLELKPKPHRRRPALKAPGPISLPFLLCLLMMFLARFIYALISNGGLLGLPNKNKESTTYQQFYSESFNSLKVIWWLLMGTRLLGSFRAKGGGLAGGGGAGAKW